MKTSQGGRPFFSCATTSSIEPFHLPNGSMLASHCDGIQAPFHKLEHQWRGKGLLPHTTMIPEPRTKFHSTPSWIPNTAHSMSTNLNQLHITTTMPQPKKCHHYAISQTNPFQTKTAPTVRADCPGSRCYHREGWTNRKEFEQTAEKQNQQKQFHSNKRQHNKI